MNFSNEDVLSNLCKQMFCDINSYKNAIDGVMRVYREEGFRRLFAGASTASTRAIFVTIGQISFYEQVKVILLASGYFSDNPLTHFLSSFTAVRKFFIHQLLFVIVLKSWCL